MLTLHNIDINAVNGKHWFSFIEDSSDDDDDDHDHPFDDDQNRDDYYYDDHYDVNQDDDHDHDYHEGDNRDDKDDKGCSLQDIDRYWCTKEDPNTDA